MADNTKIPDIEFVAGRLNEVPSPDLKVVYSDYASTLAAPEQFIFRFCQRSLVQEGEAVEVIRVYVPISHAKRLLLAMSRSLAAYEELFGSVPVEPHLTEEGKKKMALISPMRAKSDAHD